MSDTLGTKLTLQDLEFFSQEVMITIVPNFTETAITLIRGKFGPFIAQRPLEVPLWLACYLKSRGKCRLTIPVYYEEEYLSRKAEEEMSDKDGLTSLPENFFEIFLILSNKASDDFYDSMKSKSLIEDIKQLRLSKLTNFIKQLSVQNTYLIFDNITDYELSIMRPLIGESYNKLTQLNKAGN